MKRRRRRVNGRGAAAVAAHLLIAGALAACPAQRSRDEGNRAAVAKETAATATAAPPSPQLARDGVVKAAPPAPPITPGAGGAPPSVTSKNRSRPADPRAPEAATAPVDLVTIHLLVDPPQRAHVWWGAKDFGLGPLDIRRPRGSGPLDLLVRAPGYLTLHTRAFTDRDNTLSVHLVPDAEAARFPGYRAPATTTAIARPVASGASRR